MPLSSSHIQEIFNNLSSPDTSSKYWDHVSPTVNWTVIGSTPISGVYNSKQVFQDATVAYLGRDILTGPLCMQPINVIASASSPGKTSAAVEMQAVDAECRNGLKYDMRYCWVCTFDDGSEMIEQVRAYLDTDLLSRALRQDKP